MRNICLIILFALTGTGLFAQEAEPAPGTLDSVAIPGSEVTIQFVYIPAGSVTMKVGEEEKEVQVDGFWMGVRELTQEQYGLFQHKDYDSEASTWEEGEFSVDGATRPSPPYTDITFGMGNTGDFPAVSMTQQAALFYCYWLYTKTGQFFRPPTEAEWIYACLAGSEGAYPPEVTPDNIDEYAWHYQNSEEKYHETALKKPNAWGLYDMLGNVAEYTVDQYTDDYFAAIGDQLVNPWPEPAKRYGRTVKGGSFDEEPEECTCRSRLESTVHWQKRDPQIPKSIWWNTDAPFAGFRLVRSAAPKTLEEVEAFFGKAIRW